MSSYKDFKTVEDVFAHVKMDLSTLDKHFEWMPEHRRAFAKCQFILETVVEVINEGWVADWENTKQEKWYSWWDFTSKSGFGFANTLYYFDSTSTFVGSRIVFKNMEKAEHAAKFFIALYKEYYFTYGKLVSAKNLVLDAVNADGITEEQYAAIAKIIKQSTMKQYVIRHIEKNKFVSGMRGMESNFLSTDWDSVRRYKINDEADTFRKSLPHWERYEVVGMTKKQFEKQFNIVKQ